MTITVRKLTPTLGAELNGVDISNLDEATFQEIRQLWIEHELLLFRGLELTEAELVEFSRRFGALEIHVRAEYLSEEHPEILLVSNMKKADGTPLGILSERDVGWHHDQIYLPRPAVGSFLHGAKVPPSGGCTYFADLAGAYDALPVRLKTAIEGLKAVHSYEYFNGQYSVPTNKTQKERTPEVEHPLVRTHPYSGRKALYVDQGMTPRIAGLAEDESRALLQELFEFSVRPEFVYRHDWRPGDGLLWDNASTMHRRDPFDPQHERLMKRTTILSPGELAVPF